jgi:hypothetical protein
MHRDQTEVPIGLDKPQNPDPYVALEGIHRQLRHAVEDRNYSRVQDLVAQQRAVFDEAGPHHAEAVQYALPARDLAAWALTMVRLQRAHNQRALVELGALRKAHESYTQRPVRSQNGQIEG